MGSRIAVRMDGAVLLYTTWPDDASARAAGRACVEAGLAACVNVLAPMTSIYRWQGAVEHASETPMLVKTTATRAPAVREFLLARHPYDTPAIVALPLSLALSHQPFLDWIAAETSASRRD